MENKVSKTLKEQDVKYKTQEIKSLGKSLSELSADRESAEAEYAAVMEYYGKIKDRCIAKPETYEERKKSAALQSMQQLWSITGKSRTDALQSLRRMRKEKSAPRCRVCSSYGVLRENQGPMHCKA